MKRMEMVRVALAVAAAGAATTAQADVGGITTSGWMSMLGVAGVVGVLYWVYRKVG
jgi:hypothetical protein